MTDTHNQTLSHELFLLPSHAHIPVDTNISCHNRQRQLHLPLAADGAVVWLFTGVCEDVVVEAALRNEALTTDITDEVSLTRVNLAVCLKRVLCCKAKRRKN